MFPNQISNQVIVGGLTHETHTSLPTISMIKDAEKCVQKTFLPLKRKWKRPHKRNYLIIKLNRTLLKTLLTNASPNHHT